MGSLCCRTSIFRKGIFVNINRTSMFFPENIIFICFKLRIYASLNRVMIGLDNGLPPARRQASMITMMIKTSLQLHPWEQPPLKTISKLSNFCWPFFFWNDSHMCAGPSLLRLAFRRPKHVVSARWKPILSCFFVFTFSATFESMEYLPRELG